MNLQGTTYQSVASPDTPVFVPPAEAAPAIAPQTETLASVFSAEVIAGFRAWPVWMILGWDDIRQRYRRSVIGPFWITLSMGIFILLLGVIYSRLFQTDVRIYIPFLSSGFIIWGFISQTTNESCMAFSEASRIIKQIKLPYSIYVLRVAWRNLIVLAHTIVIFIPVAIVFRVAPTSATFLVVPGLFFVLINMIWAGTVLAVLSTRYRDITPIVATGVQIAMFCTPIMWPKTSLGDASIIAEINPLYHLIELVRAPLLGTAPELRSWLIAAGLAVVGCSLAVLLIVRKSRRVVFWL